MQPNSECILTFGMHRSGTSALAGSLAQMGVDFGHEEDLFSAQSDNSRGYWEHQTLVMLNEEILSSLGRNWDDLRPMPDNWWTEPAMDIYRAKIVGLVHQHFSGSALWGFKDPRLCKLLPLWMQALTEAGVGKTHLFMIVRHPVEVVASLQKRDAFSREKAILLWLDYFFSSLHYTQDEGVHYLTYDQLMSDQTHCETLLARALDTPLKITDEVRKGLSHFLSSDLRHSKADNNFREPGYHLAIEVYETLEKLASHSDIHLLEKLTHQKSAYDDIQSLLLSLGNANSYTKENYQLRNEIAQNTKNRIQFEGQFSELTAAYNTKESDYVACSDALDRTKLCMEELESRHSHLSDAYDQTQNAQHQTQEAYDNAREAYDNAREAYDHVKRHNTSLLQQEIELQHRVTELEMLWPLRLMRFFQAHLKFW